MSRLEPFSEEMISIFNWFFILCRWEGIQAIRIRDGALGLSHFKLLKRLGCGDIGSVYLAELRGSHSHFAMKVFRFFAFDLEELLLRIIVCTLFFA